MDLLLQALHVLENHSIRLLYTPAPYKLQDGQFFEHFRSRKFAKGGTPTLYRRSQKVGLRAPKARGFRTSLQFSGKIHRSQVF